MSAMNAPHTAGLTRPASCGGTTAPLCLSEMSRLAPEPVLRNSMTTLCWFSAHGAAAIACVLCVGVCAPAT
jgi:hypothetical protein